MQSNFICYTCNHKPLHFIVLLCGHIICSKCLDPFHKKPQKISIVKCRCGKKTCCKQNNMGLLLTTPDQIKNVKSRLIEDENTQISTFNLNQQQSDISENLYYQKSNIITNNQFPFVSNASFLKTEPLIIDENPFFYEDSYIVKKDKYKQKPRQSKGVRSVRSNQSMSPISYSQKISEKESPNNKENKRNLGNMISPTIMPNKINSNINKNPLISSTDSMVNFSNQLKNQLSFLSIQFDKQIQQCRTKFQKIIKKLKTSYQKLKQDIERFYLQQVLGTKDEGSILRQDLMLNLSQIVRQKYQKNLGSKITKLHQNLMQILDNNVKRSLSRCNRQTVHLLQGNVDDSQSIISKSSKKSKPKQCALYVAINPQTKKDKVVNYIDVIKADFYKNNKKNLIKKTLKGQKFKNLERQY